MVEMRIAVDARPAVWYQGTGIGQYTLQLIKALLGRFPTNRYLLVWPPGEPFPFPSADNFSLCPVPKDEGVEASQLPRWLDAAGVQVYHAPQNGFRAPSSTTVPLVVTIHDLIPFVMPEVVRPGFRRRFLHELPRIVERADLVVTVSETSKRDLIRILEVPARKIRAIYPAAGEAFHPLPPEEVHRCLEQRFGLKRRYILYVGGMNERKGVPDLIFAYAKVRRYLDPGHQLVIAGKIGRHEERLVGLAASLGLEDEVVFPGFIPPDDMPVLYNGASLFVYPSLYEGFGLPPLEAMACGKPVIIARTPALLEVAGPAALAVKPGDTLALANTIHKVLADPDLAHDLAERGREQARSFSWTRAVEQLVDAYQSAVIRHHR